MNNTLPNPFMEINKKLKPKRRRKKTKRQIINKAVRDAGKKILT